MVAGDYGVSRDNVTRKGHEGVFFSEATVLYPDNGGGYRSPGIC